MAFYCRWAPRSTRWHPQTHTVFPPTIKLSNWSLASHTVSLYVAIKKKSCMIRVIKKSMETECLKVMCLDMLIMAFLL